MRKIWIWVLIIATILVIIRLMLPSIIKSQINKTLDELEGYDGSVDDINLALIRGAYVIKGLTLVEDSAAIPVPFVSIPRIDLSVHWNALLKGKIVGEIIIDQPAINFAVDEEATQDGSEVKWQDVVKDLLPIQINRFEIRKGAISYYDFTTKPELEVYLQQFDLVVTNLTNVEQENERLPSTIYATGTSLGGGIMNINARLNPLKEIPDIDLELAIENVDMTALNDFVRAYTNTDIKHGTFNLYSEIVIDDAQLTGYVRPILEDLKILDWDEEEGGFLKKAWEALVEGVKLIFENPEEEQVATQVPLQGDLSANVVDAGILPTIWGLFRNAFIEALSKQTEDAIDFPLQGEGNS